MFHNKNMQELIKKLLTHISDDIKEVINGRKITLTSYENKNEILKNIDLQKEAGYAFFDDGSALVSMYCQMEGNSKRV